MTGLRERLAEVLTGRCARPRVTAAAVLGVLGDQDTHALIARVLAEHVIHETNVDGDGWLLVCRCNTQAWGLTDDEADAKFATHQAAAVVAALTEEQT